MCWSVTDDTLHCGAGKVATNYDSLAHHACVRRERFRYPNVTPTKQQDFYSALGKAIAAFAANASLSQISLHGTIDFGESPAVLISHSGYGVKKQTAASDWANNEFSESMISILKHYATRQPR